MRLQWPRHTGPSLKDSTPHTSAILGKLYPEHQPSRRNQPHLKQRGLKVYSLLMEQRLPFQVQAQGGRHRGEQDPALLMERRFTAYAVLKAPCKMHPREHHPSNQNSSQSRDHQEEKNTYSTKHSCLYAGVTGTLSSLIGDRNCALLFYCHHKYYI
jgi:hypothetical protein